MTSHKYLLYSLNDTYSAAEGEKKQALWTNLILCVVFGYKIILSLTAVLVELS